MLGPNGDDTRRLLALDQAWIHTMQSTKDKLVGNYPEVTVIKCLNMQMMIIVSQIISTLTK